jgi:hypothetical protein
MEERADAVRVPPRLGKDQIATRILSAVALIVGALAVGMAFIPSSYDYNAGQNKAFCPIPALYDRSGFVHALTSNGDPNNGFGDEVAENLADECGDKIEHHLRMSVGATTLTVPFGFLALFLYVRRRLRSLSTA